MPRGESEWSIARTNGTNDIPRRSPDGITPSRACPGSRHNETCHEAVPDAPVAPEPASGRVTLRQAAEAVLHAWDGVPDNGTASLAVLRDPIDILRSVLTKRAPTPATDSSKPPREGTKQAQVLAMLRGPEGTTVAQIAAAMTWAPHTVRGFFAGLKKRHGITVTARPRSRATAGLAWRRRGLRSGLRRNAGLDPGG